MKAASEQVSEQVLKQFKETKGITDVQQALLEEKALNTKCHGVLLHAISALTAKLFIPPPCHCFYPLVLFMHQLFALSICTICLTLVISYPGYFALLL